MPPNSPADPPQRPAYQYPPPPTERPRRRLSKLRSLTGTLLLFILAPLIALSITAFAFQSYEVDGDSMETTLQNKDRLIVNKISRSWARLKDKNYIPERGSIVVFEQRGLYAGSGDLQRQLIKRVIGLPGERVVVKNGVVTVYSRQYPDGFNPDRSGLYAITAKQTSGSYDVTLRQNELFVLGDNRVNSADSRIFGPIQADQIVGTLALRIFPINKAERF